MTLMGGLAAAGKAIADKAKETAKALAGKAEAEFGEQLRRPVRDTVRGVRQVLSDGVTQARGAAADAIARGGAGLSTKAAAEIAPEDHWTRSASRFLDLTPQQRTVVYAVLGILAVVLIAMIVRKR